MRLSAEIQQLSDSGDVGLNLEGIGKKVALLEFKLEELMGYLEASYSGSPEGRIYLQKTRNQINNEE